MTRFLTAFVGLILMAVLATTAQAVTIETVPVENPGNMGELSGSEAGGYGPDAIVGRVNYEYRIGKYEVTTGQYTEFLNAVAGVDTYGLYDSDMWPGKRACMIERYTGSGTIGDPYQYRIAADWANRPVTRVTWGDAARFCNWLRNGQPTGLQNASTTENGSYALNGATSQTALLAIIRDNNASWVIPSEDEWYKAAYHKNDGVTGNYFNYPTGTDSMPSNDLIDPDPGNNATFAPTGVDRTIGEPYWRTEIGAHENSESPYGTFDQGGNVKEWNEAVINAEGRGSRGGDWSDYPDMMVASTRLGHLGPSRDSTFIGFRVARVPEPGSIALLLCGLTSLLCWRHRK